MKREHIDIRDGEVEAVIFKLVLSKDLAAKLEAIRVKLGARNCSDVLRAYIIGFALEGSGWEHPSKAAKRGNA